MYTFTCRSDFAVHCVHNLHVTALYSIQNLLCILLTVLFSIYQRLQTLYFKESTYIAKQKLTLHAKT